MILKLLQRIGARRPYFHIYGDDGSLYMGRWWLFGGSGFSLATGMPRDDRTEEQRGWRRSWLDALVGFWVAARLHHIAREDRSRDYHTHPASFVSLVVSGWYRERRPLDQAQRAQLDQIAYSDTVRRPGSIAYRRMGLTWEECGAYVPAMQRGPQDTAQTEMQRLLELSARQAAANDRLRGALETVRDKLRVDDPHGLYDLVCDALTPNAQAQPRICRSEAKANTSAGAPGWAQDGD